MTTRRQKLLIRAIVLLVAPFALGMAWAWLAFPEQGSVLELHLHDNHLRISRWLFGLAVGLQLYSVLHFGMISYRLLLRSTFWTMVIQLPILVTYIALVYQLLTDFGIRPLISKAVERSLWVTSLQVMPAFFLLPAVSALIILLTLWRIAKPFKRT